MAQDYAKARELFEKAAAKGDYLAMIYLGDLYRNGRVSQDDANARRHGDLHVYQNGWEVDEANAREWYEKAAAALRHLELAFTPARR